MTRSLPLVRQAAEATQVNRATFHALQAWGIAAGTVALQLAFSTGYGFHRDELYFLAASRHPAWGYVDQPPLTPTLARISTELFSESLVGLRLWPALAGGLVAVIAALLAREFGGARLAQAIAAMCVAGSTVYLGIFHLFGTAAFDQLAWAVCLLLVARLLGGADARWWLAVGAVAGVGLLNKHLIVLLAIGLPIGLLLAPGQRHQLRQPWFWLGGALALTIAAPNLAWQAANDWPQLEMSGALRDRNSGLVTQLLLVPMQILTHNLVLAPVWIAGLWWLLRSPEGREFRALGITYVALLALLVTVGGKHYYVSPLYVVLFAAGGVATARWLSTRARPRPGELLVSIAVAGLVGAPIGLPILPARAHAVIPISGANPDILETIGWPALVQQVADVRDTLPPDEREGVVVYTQNYGQAGAIERFGARHGLPQPVSGHNTYWLWGPPGTEQTTTIAVGFQRDHLEELFADVTLATTIDNGLGVDNAEQGNNVWICRDPREPWPQLWPLTRHYN